MARARARRVALAEPLVASAGIDYADAFEIELAEPDGRSAEEWVRSALEDVPGLVRSTILLVHRHVLRFRLAPPGTPGHLLGWRIVTAEADVFVLETASSFLAGTLVGRRPD